MKKSRQPYRRQLQRLLEAPAPSRESRLAVVPAIDPAKRSAGLTDHRLADLLQRIDAKNCMTSISLTGCSQINGNGLWPLQDSTVLRTIDLRRAELNHGLLLHARPLAVSAQQFLVQMLPRLDSVGGSVTGDPTRRPRFKAAVRFLPRASCAPIARPEVWRGVKRADTWRLRLCCFKVVANLAGPRRRRRRVVLQHDAKSEVLLHEIPARPSRTSSRRGQDHRRE